MNNTTQQLAGQLQNCVNLLHRLKRTGTAKDASLADDAIDQANRAIYLAFQNHSMEAKLATALKLLLADSQHKGHDCGDAEFCPILHAQKVLTEYEENK